MESTEQPVSDAPTALPVVSLDESHIYCPHCAYDLTGAPTNRCAECGKEFDLQALMRWRYEPNHPLPVEGFGQIAVASLLNPRLLGRQMPRFPRLRDATLYALSMRILVAGLVVFAVLCTTGSLEEVASALVVGVAVAASSHVCEAVLSVAFLFLVRGRIAYGQLDYPFWRTLTACFSTHLLVSCLVALAAAAIASVNPEGGYLLFLVAFPIALIWWWYSLGQGVAGCGDISTGWVVAVILIPVIGVGAVFLGLVLMSLLGTVCSI